MCGIVGLFLKDKELEPHLGAMLTDMLITMTDRGPDSAGIAIYGSESEGHSKLTIQSEHPKADFAVERIQGLTEFLRQKPDEKFPMEDCQRILHEALGPRQLTAQ